ncbi:MAG: NBR1-Ig-like domain-containing protein [Gammaproteobacteria bacterium]|nr:NBR1-Ig-like domain-containing protein [Gammaproteobacteria bacterium]
MIISTKRANYIKVGVSLFLLAVCSTSLHAAVNYDAKIDKVSIKTKMLVGRSYTAKVTVSNTGASTWTKSSNIKLVTTGNAKNAWKYSAGTLSRDERIPPGNSKTFEITLTAPNRTGIYGIQFQSLQDGNTMSSNSKAKMIVVEDRANRVKFISQLLPEKMETSQEYAVVIQFRNNGTSTWSRHNNYKLGLKSLQEVWNTSTELLGKNTVIPPGQIGTFQFNLKAPDKAGHFPIQWQMKKGNKSFGEPTPKLMVEVSESKSSSGAEFVYQNVPGTQKLGALFTVLNRGEIYPVDVTFKNTSDKNWTPGHVALGAQNPANSMNWSVDRIELKSSDTILPGEIKSFSFKIIAPLKPGIYNFQWQMLRGFKTWIGEKSENISITVK